MIIIDNIRNIKNHEGFVNVIIVRNIKNPIENTIQCIDLAPSSSLFHNYYIWIEQGIWNENTFQNRYVPIFIRDLKNSTRSIAVLNSLYLASEKMDIALYCYCQDEAICHRSIVAGILKGAGSNIQCSEEYLKYWDIYNSM